MIKSNSKKYIILFLSIIVVFFMFPLAPREYNYTYCLTCFFIFIINIYFFFKIQIERLGIFNFHTFFVVSYFFMHIFYLSFVYPIDPTLFFIFEFGFNKSVVCKAQIISVIGILFYILAVYIFSSNNINYKSSNLFSTISITKKQLKIVLIITIISFVTYIYVRGLNSFFSKYEDNLENLQKVVEGGFLSFLTSFFYIMIFILICFTFIYIRKNNYNSLSQMLIKNKVTCILLGCILFLYFISGSRTLILRIGLCILCFYSIYIKRLPGLFFISLFFCGLIFLGVLSRVRTSEDKVESILTTVKSESLLGYTMDLVSINRNAFLAIDEVEKNGYSYGLTFSKGFFSFLPYYPAIANSFDLSQSDIDSEVFFQEKTSINFSPGSSIVGDLYLSGGLFTTILGLFFLGYFISLAEKRSVKSIYWLYIYGILLSASFIYPRFGYFFLMRTFIWGLILIFLFKNLTMQKRFS